MDAVKRKARVARFKFENKNLIIAIATMEIKSNQKPGEREQTLLNDYSVIERNKLAVKDQALKR